MRWMPAIVALLLSGSGVAWAQSSMSPIGPAACLQLEGAGPTTPEYPESALKRKEGGTVPVELTFTAPDRAPKVKLLDEGAAATPILDAVDRHARRLRLPCMSASSAPVVLRQEYVFQPNDGRKVVASAAEDAADADERERLKCLVHVDGAKRPDYPDWARRQDVQENILVELRFERPDRAPLMRVLAPRGKVNLLRPLQDFVNGWRLPCLGGKPILTTTVFKYQLEGGARLVLKDLSLKALIGASRDLPAPVYFDLNTMACPFDLRLQYMQPFGRNDVGELEASVPARRPFIDWLRDARLNLTERQSEQVLGDTITVTVPCGTVDL